MGGGEGGEGGGQAAEEVEGMAGMAGMREGPLQRMLEEIEKLGQETLADEEAVTRVRDQVPPFSFSLTPFSLSRSLNTLF